MIRLPVKKIELVYVEAEDLLSDIESFSIKEGFSLTEECFMELLYLVEHDSEIAKVISINAVSLLMASKNKQEVESLIKVAEMATDGG
jgi:hypothetical protein